MLIAIVGLIVLVVLFYYAFVSFYPSFGGDLSETDKEQYSVSENFRNEQFVNVKNVPEDLSFGEMLSLSRKFFFTKVPNSRPEQQIPVQSIDSSSVAEYNGETRLVWFGHSSFLLQMDGKTLLIDPMLSEVPAPHPLLGAKRFNEENPLDTDKLPKIDAVVISHDHYDHLDYKTIKKIKDKVSKFYVPLGVKVHLLAWDVTEEKIVERDWWEDANHDGIQLVCTPAQHFSGRKFNNRQSTLWSSWVIIGKEQKLFFSGDSGYSDHFTAIGEAYGPFDFAMLECGQYNTMWPDIHMFPEETAQAALDVRAKAMMPIHWGTFKLALHEWTDPILRVQAKAAELNVHLVTPIIGEPVILSKLPTTQSEWWK